MIEKKAEASPPNFIRPSSHFIGSGDLLRSQHGRLLLPVPKLSFRSERAARAAHRALAAWIAREAETEASRHPDKFLLSHFDPRNMSNADMDTANWVLFGDECGPADQHRVNPAVVGGRLTYILPETG